jgi:hypothetical protein
MFGSIFGWVVCELVVGYVICRGGGGQVIAGCGGLPVPCSCMVGSVTRDICGNWVGILGDGCSFGTKVDSR